MFEDTVVPQEGFLPAEEQPVVGEQSFMPVSEVAPVVRVPRNIDEVTTQLAYAVDKEDQLNMRERMGAIATRLRAGDTPALLSEALIQEYDDRVAGAKQAAGAYLTSQQADKALFAAKEITRLEQERTAANSDNRPVEAQQAVTARALERVAMSEARRLYSNMDSFDRQVQTNAGAVAARNIIAQAEAKLEEKGTVWDTIGQIGRAIFLPFWDDAMTVKAINKVIGTDIGVFDKYKAVTELRNFMLGIPTDAEREEVVQRIVGQLSSNPEVAATALRQLRELTRGDANADFGFNAVQVVDTAALLHGLSKVARAGVPLLAVKNTAGEGKAGELAATDLIGKTSVSGLTEQELFARAIAAGVNPLEADPAMAKGINAATQTELKKSWDAVMKSLQERLDSSTLTAEEKAAELARINASYMPSSNKQYYHVVMGEASDTGVDLTLYLQSKAGRAFGSEKAAHKAAKDAGITDYKIVLKNEVDEAGSVRASAINMIDEVEGVKLEVEAVKDAMAQAQKQIDWIAKNYTELDGTSVTSRFEFQQILKYGKELVDNFKTIKNYNDVYDWVTHADEFYQYAESLGLKINKKGIGQAGVAPPKKAVANVGLDPNVEAQILDKLSDGIKNNTIGESLKGLELKAFFQKYFKYDTPFAKFIADTYAEAFGKGHKSVSGKRILEHIAKSDNKANAELARLLLRKGASLNWDKMGVHLAPMSQRVEAAYRTSNDTVLVPINSVLKNSSVKLEDVMVHELTHAHNTQVITLALRDPKLAAKVLSPAQIKAANDINTLRLNLRAAMEDGAIAPPSNIRLADAMLEFPDELLAYGTSDASARAWLSSVKLKDIGMAGEESVWTYLWSKFKHILGFTGDDTALAALFKSFDELADATDTRTVLNNLVKNQELSSRNMESMLAVRDKKRATSKPQFLIQQTRHDTFSYKAVGQFSENDIKSMPWVALDPKHGASELGVEARVVGVHAEAKVQKALVDFITPYWRGLSGDGKARVRSLLEEGDSFSNGGAVGKEFSYGEALGKGLNDKEATAYLATRQLRMAMYHIRNGEMVRHLRAQGMKEVEFLGTPTKTIGTPLDTFNGAVYDVSTKKMVNVDATTPLPATKRVVKLATPTEVDGELRSLVAVDAKSAIVKDIQTALHYRPGEFSRIYTDEYFITMSRNTKVDGVTQPVTETIRTAMSPREAKEFTDNLTAAVAVMRSGRATDEVLEDLIGRNIGVDNFKKAYDSGYFEDVTKFDFHYTRNKDEYLNGSVAEALANGRLFTSKRSDKLLSVDAERPNTLGVFESLEAEITSVSRVSSVTQWRETMVRRWMNTFGDLLPNRTGDDVADFFSAANAKFTKGDGKESLFAERTHKYIMRQIGLRTDEEQFYQHMTRRMSEAAFKGNEKIETIGQKVRELGVLGLVRNINFNLTLGMFNPAQLLVQANGAATAMILSPLHGLAAAKTFPLLRMALMSDNPSVWRHFASVESLTSLGLTKVDEFVDLVKAVRQTGIIDNIKSTALFNREEGRLNIFNAYPSRVLGSNTFFFNRGEEFSRLVAFDVARREFMAANKEIAWNSKEGLAKIVVRMDDLTQNMTKANLARFQEGLMSIPLQFAQYNIKLGMNVMTSLLGKGEGRGFTRGEAVQLLVGHILLYGAAGNGLSMLLDEIVPKNVKETMSPQQKTYLAQGMIAGLVSTIGEELTGERTSVALGTRFGAFNYYQQLAEAAYKDPKTIHEVLLGPTLSTAKRLGTIGEVAALWMRDPDLSSKDILSGLARITTEQVSTLRNGAKAYLYYQHQNKLIDSKGVTTAQLTTPEVLAQALGFQPSVSVDVSNLIKTKADHTEALKDIAGLIFKVQKDIMTARVKGDHAYADEQHKLLLALWPVNAGDLFEVQRMVRDRLYPYDSDMEKLLGQYVWKGHTYNQPVTVTTPPRKEQK
jgi:hypothetical protein